MPPLRSLPTVPGSNNCVKLLSLIRYLVSEWGREQIILYTKFPFATKCLYFQPDKIIQLYIWLHMKSYVFAGGLDYKIHFQLLMCISNNLLCLWKHKLNRLPTDQPHTCSWMWCAGLHQWVSLQWCGHGSTPPVGRQHATEACLLATLLWQWPFYEQESMCRQRQQTYARWRGLSQNADTIQWTPEWRRASQRWPYCTYYCWSWRLRVWQ